MTLFLYFTTCSKQLARESKIHSYGKSFNGFVARLLPHEAEKLQGINKLIINIYG